MNRAPDGTEASSDAWHCGLGVIHQGSLGTPSPQTPPEFTYANSQERAGVGGNVDKEISR